MGSGDILSVLDRREVVWERTYVSLRLSFAARLLPVRGFRGYIRHRVRRSNFPERTFCIRHRHGGTVAGTGFRFFPGLSYEADSNDAYHEQKFEDVFHKSFFVFYIAKGNYFNLIVTNKLALKKGSFTAPLFF